MVENMVDDGVELKPSIIEAHVDFIVKLPLKLQLKSKFPIKLLLKRNLPVFPSFVIMK